MRLETNPLLAHVANQAGVTSGAVPKGKKNIDTSVELCYSITMKVGDTVRVKDETAIGVRENGKIISLHQKNTVAGVEWRLHGGGVLYQSELLATLEPLDENR